MTIVGLVLREIGEEHHDLNSGNPDVSSKAAGHSKETKVRHYKMMRLLGSAGIVCEVS